MRRYRWPLALRELGRQAVWLDLAPLGDHADEHGVLLDCFIGMSSWFDNRSIEDLPLISTPLLDGEVYPVQLSYTGGGYDINIIVEIRDVDDAIVMRKTTTKPNAKPTWTRELTASEELQIRTYASRLLAAGLASSYSDNSLTGLDQKWLEMANTRFTWRGLIVPQSLLDMSEYMLTLTE